MNLVLKNWKKKEKENKTNAKKKEKTRKNQSYAPGSGNLKEHRSIKSYVNEINKLEIANKQWKPSHEPRCILFSFKRLIY